MFSYIDTAAQLQSFIDKHHDNQWVILDTEFIRERTYFPRLCLIQLATHDQLVCIDPIQIEDLTPLFDWLHQPSMTKVFHAGSQDIEIIYKLSGKTPSPIFDTQIAAAVLGQGDQIGYGRLVENMLGVILDKSQSRTDWSKRPLRQEQLAYAIDDVRYLRDIYPMMLEQLHSLGRMSWLNKPLERLADPVSYDIDARNCWRKVKGLQVLKPAQLAILREITAWRETQAVEQNIPRRWVLADEVCVDMARMKISKATDLANIRGLKPELIDRHSTTWLQLIETAQAQPASEWPQLKRRTKLEGEQAFLVDLLMVLVNQQAHHNNISVQALATRPQVEKMISEGNESFSDDWRGSLLNKLFSEVLNGNKCIQIKDQQITIRDDF